LTDRGIPAIGGSSERTIDAVDYCVRSVLFVGTFLIVWISLQPFQSLAHPPTEITEGGSRINQIGFAVLFVLFATWAYFNGLQRLKLLLRPALMVMVLWFLVSALLSWEPGLSLRRLAFSLILMAISATVLLLPRNIRHFADLMAAAVLIVLVVSYLGILLTPSLAVHQPTDFLEPEHAGNWRGVFPHKNQAGATMVIFIFIGLFVARMRSLLVGGLITVLALTFLIFSYSKTAIALAPMAFIFAAVIARAPRSVAIVIALGTLAILNLFTIGSIFFEPVRAILDATISDPSFTGRTAIWQFAVEHIAERPITGYGFAAFWGTEYVVRGLEQSFTWANAATDAHNAYLNLAITVGIPGLLLVIVWIVLLPIADFCRTRAAGMTPLQMLFLRVWLFGILASCFESVLFQQIGEAWFFMMTSIFGLRYLSISQLTR
jgi:O-antigen ligase